MMNEPAPGVSVRADLRKSLAKFGRVTERDVSDQNADRYLVSVFTVESPTRVIPFHVFAADALQNLRLQDVKSVLQGMETFIQGIDDRSPCYIAMNVSKLDSMTIEQIKYAASVFKKNQPLIATRLVGTILDIGSEVSNFMETLWKVFCTFYTPTRPVCMAFKDGDIDAFIEEWEGKIASMVFE